MPESKSGYKYILAVKDALTSWIELIPLKSKSMWEVSSSMVDQVYFRHGAAKAIITDNGTEFVNKMQNAIHHLLNMKYIRTTPYNPQANGKIE